jgi:hypothetical protein
MLNQGSRLRPFVKGLALAFVNATPTAHRDVPCSVEVHEWDAPGDLRDPRRSCREVRIRETNREPDSSAT